MKRALVTASAFLTIVAAAHAQSKPRWKMEIEHSKPEIYTYRSPLDKLENYWFVVYTLTNPTDEVLPLLVDTMLYTETGKDLQNDVRKVDSEPTKKTLEDSRAYESLKFGRFYPNVVVPENVEYKIIEYHAGLGNRSPGIVRSSIEALKKGFDEDPLVPEVRGTWRKGDRLYLNAVEMRQQRFIKPGQKIQCVAIFPGVDPRGRIIELHVSGLWDVVRIDGYDSEDVRMHYENRVLKVSYAFAGDEFERERDVLVQRRREWVVKAIGPIASKETLTSLVDAILARLKLEESWTAEDVKPEDKEKSEKSQTLTPVDMVVCARVISRAVGQDFGYDTAKSVLENKASIWRLHEWWVTNRSKLAFNEATGRFEVRDDVLPGTQKD